MQQTLFLMNFGSISCSAAFGTGPATEIVPPINKAPMIVVMMRWSSGDKGRIGLKSHRLPSLADEVGNSLRSNT